ncbi:GAF domain-like protein [Suhomyces tanzawaensis NRRL Y-17324]|uniref:GAF domain-like protein n=1 Tax=Suhomyces tanzawaensis NRRL Y-17324 TaxID=984487 RepID=A0A1E4SDS1_9ASCO|nr:GAF domain-like protein [Suhomyces tanzawaensis NRRL Y-17324]ODV77664.1 GAF domain-like protein [Suhomyces tanzawaensis NRRL Y-17324]
MPNHADHSNYSAGLSKSEVLESVLLSYEALSSDTSNWVANLANCSSLVWHAYHSLGIKVNWAGFYVLNKEVEGELILGPFHGKVACQTIKIGKGVCGAAAQTKETQLVANVHEFPGHIACDGDTNSEIVVPLVKDNVTFGVLDIDCLELNGFDATDREYLEKLAQLIIHSCTW